jgi:predicted ester cyclase
MVDHNPFPEQAPGLEGLKQKVMALGAAFSEMRTTVDFLVAEGSLVVDHWASTARHTGEFMGVPRAASAWA